MNTQGHPNAVNAAGAGGFGIGLAYLLNQYAHTHLNAYDIGFISTGLATLRLWIGRRGIRGALVGLWHGTAGPPTPTPPAV